MWPRIRLLLIVLSFSLNIAFVAAWGMKSASVPKREPVMCEPDSCRVWCPLHRELGTTDSQWTSLEPLQRKFQLTCYALSDTATALRAGLMDLLAQPKPDQSAVEAKQGEILAIQRQMQALVVNHLLEEKTILTAEQQSKLFAMMRDNGGCGGHPGMTGASTGGPACGKK
jgi:Spy/CpxP family protein refolding chaperone